MADLSQFLTNDADNVPASTGVPEAVPAGDYDLQQEASELVQTRDKTGMLLKVTLAVVSGQYEGRKIFPQFNIINKNVQAQNIGIGDFKALCLACDIPYEQAKLDTSLLDYKPFKAKIGFDKPNINPETGEAYAPKNRVLKFYPAGSAPETAPVASGQTQAAPAAQTARAAPAASGGLPWKKSA